jgi:hypothetical protein
MRTLTAVVAVTVCVLAGCSKSPVESTVDAANAVGAKLLAPLAQKDASRQAEALIRKLADRPDCEVYKDRLREGGHGSPYAGVTQLALIEAYQDATKAGCGKAN